MEKTKCISLKIAYSLLVLFLCLSATNLSAQVEVDENSDVWIGGFVTAPNPDNRALNVFGRMTMRYPSQYLNNVIIGTNNGNAGMTKPGNVIIGANTGTQMVAAKGNLLFGNTVGANLINGSSNVCLGAFSGNQLDNSLYNLFIGTFTGNNFKSNHNVSIGFGAGTATDNSSPICTGANNILIGRDAGSYIQGGALDNVAIGTFAMVGLQTGSFNTAIGFQSLGHIETGQRNVAIGAYSGDYNLGSNNVFIGYKAGETASSNPTTFSNRLYIDNSNTTTPLIYGEFNSNLVRINGNFDVTGTASASCGVLSCSDIRYKKNFKKLENPLSKIQLIDGLYYDWNQKDFPDKGFDDATYLGFKAQEVEKQFPEMVRTDSEGYKSVDYSRMTVVLLEGMKEQQKQIEQQEEQIAQQQELMATLQQENEMMKSQMSEIVSLLKAQAEAKESLDSVAKNKK